MIDNNLINFKVMGDERGSLIPFEKGKNVPFDIKRVFYIYGTQKDISRGQHSHYRSKQLLIAINGSCKVTLDNGKKRETYTLNKPNVGLFQNALIWGEMHDFSQDCILMVFSDSYYRDSDYIRDYDDFLEIVNYGDR